MVINEESQPSLEGNLVKANLIESVKTSSVSLPRDLNLDREGNLEPIPRDVSHSHYFQEIFLFC